MLHRKIIQSFEEKKKQTEKHERNFNEKILNVPPCYSTTMTLVAGDLRLTTAFTAGTIDMKSPADAIRIPVIMKAGL